MSKLLQRLGTAALALGLSQAAMAITIYDNGAPNLVYGTAMAEFKVSENFTLGTAYDLTNLRFWSIQDAAASYTGSVFWEVSTPSGAQPGAIVATGLAAVAATPTGGSTSFGYGVYAFNIPVAFSLSAGNYWLTLHNGPMSNITPSEMLWATTAVQVGSFGLYNDGTWINSGNEHAFAIDGNVAVIPEPATAGLMLAGLAGALSLARRRRAAA